MAYNRYIMTTTNTELPHKSLAPVAKSEMSTITNLSITRNSCQASAAKK